MLEPAFFDFNVTTIYFKLYTMITNILTGIYKEKLLSYRQQTKLKALKYIDYYFRLVIDVAQTGDEGISRRRLMEGAMSHLRVKKTGMSRDRLNWGEGISRNRLKEAVMSRLRLNWKNKGDVASRL